MKETEEAATLSVDERRPWYACEAAQELKSSQPNLPVCIIHTHSQPPPPHLPVLLLLCLLLPPFNAQGVRGGGGCGGGGGSPCTA